MSKQHLNLPGHNLFLKVIFCVGKSKDIRHCDSQIRNYLTPYKFLKNIFNGSTT